jgi:uncharacterized RDD family membrane protein YckC
MRFFNRIKLKTPESVELEFVLAGLGGRVLAWVIDSHILWLSYMLVLVVFSFLSEGITELLDRAGLLAPGFQNWIVAIITLFTFFWFTGYFALFETLWRGQTPGKRWAKIRVIRDDGRPVGLAQAAVRSLLRPIDDLLFLGFFFVLIGKQEKRIGDWTAGTVVVQEELAPVGSSAFPLGAKAQNVADRLLDTPQIQELLPDDFAILREYLQRRIAMEPPVRQEVSLKLARQFKNLLHMDELPFEMTSDLFLEGIYLAYQQQSPEL